jgi:hypothetical protein
MGALMLKRVRHDLTVVYIAQKFVLPIPGNCHGGRSPWGLAIVAGCRIEPSRHHSSVSLSGAFQNLSRRFPGNGNFIAGTIIAFSATGNFQFFTITYRLDRQGDLLWRCNRFKTCL